jgi:hypothetical protein
MGRSKGTSPERKTHRNAAVLRRRVAVAPKPTLKSHDEVISEAMKDPAFRKAYEAKPHVFMVDTPTGPHAQFGCVMVPGPDPAPHPTSKQRAYFWRLTIGAIKVIVAGLILALVLGVGLLVVSRGG